MIGKKAAWVIYLVLALIWGYGIYSLSTSDSYQWDFKTYYYAAEAHARGLDWWDPAVLSGVAQIEVKLAYVYPPATIWFFRCFTLFDYNSAYQIWLALKLVLLGLLVFLWRQHFFERNDWPLFLLFTTLAFGSAAYWDLVAGNIGIFEQAVLWLGIWGLLKERLWLFVCCVLIVALFKLTFVLFLFLPWLINRRTHLRPALFGACAFVIYLFANQFLYSRESGVFWSIIGSLDERGEAYNHALLAFCRDSVETVMRPLGLESSAIAAGSIIYVLIAGVVLVITWRWWKEGSSATGSPTHRLVAVCMFTLGYALIMPRMKTYSFILLIPAGWYIIRHCLRPSLFVLLFILISLTKWTPLPVPDLARLLWWYYPWLTALVLWVILLTQKNHESSISL